jgi:hypothetical protein
MRIHKDWFQPPAYGFNFGKFRHMKLRTRELLKGLTLVCSDHSVEPGAALLSVHAK